MPSIVCPVAMPTNSGMPAPTAYRAPRTGWNSDRLKRAIPTTMRLSAATWSIGPGRSWRLGRHLAGGLLVGQLGQPRRVLVGPGDHLVGGLPAGLRQEPRLHPEVHRLRVVGDDRKRRLFGLDRVAARQAQPDRRRG